jgi:hypothetical protein
VNLAHLLELRALALSRVTAKNDVRDATDLADLLRMGRLPEANVAPPALWELRELVRHRAKLVMLRSGLKSQVHAVLAKKASSMCGPVTCSGCSAAPSWTSSRWARRIGLRLIRCCG